MKTHEWHSRRTELSDELAELEQASGISPEDSEKAWFGQLKLMPALDPTPVRDLYFGVADSVARKGLMGESQRS